MWSCFVLDIDRTHKRAAIASHSIFTMVKSLPSFENTGDWHGTLFYVTECSLSLSLSLSLSDLYFSLFPLPFLTSKSNNSAHHKITKQTQCLRQRQPPRNHRWTQLHVTVWPPSLLTYFRPPPPPPPVRSSSLSGCRLRRRGAWRGRWPWWTRGRGRSTRLRSLRKAPSKPLTSRRYHHHRMQSNLFRFVTLEIKFGELGFAQFSSFCEWFLFFKKKIPNLVLKQWNLENVQWSLNFVKVPILVL